MLDQEGLYAAICAGILSGARVASLANHLRRNAQDAVFNSLNKSFSLIGLVSFPLISSLTFYRPSPTHRALS